MDLLDFMAQALANLGVISQELADDISKATETIKKFVSLGGISEALAEAVRLDGLLQEAVDEIGDAIPDDLGNFLNDTLETALERFGSEGATIAVIKVARDEVDRLRDEGILSGGVANSIGQTLDNAISQLVKGHTDIAARKLSEALARLRQVETNAQGELDRINQIIDDIESILNVILSAARSVPWELRLAAYVPPVRLAERVAA